MKKSAIFLVTFFVFTNLFSQGIPVSHAQEKKNVVLEEYTGIHCPNCPNGHKYGNQIKAANPNDVVLVNIHEGGYAVPNTGEPDFRTSFGTALSNLANVSGYPNATINRHDFNLETGGPAMTNRLNWVTAANQVLTENASANLGMEASIDVQTRLLTVRVQVYYTGNPAYPSNNRLNVAVLQDNVEGPQTGSSGNPSQVLPNGNYLHMHILRHLVTGQYGRQLPTVGSGITIDSIFTYTLPDSIKEVPLVMTDVHVAAYVTDGLQEVITGYDIFPTFTNFPGANSVKAVSAAIENDAVCGFTAAPIVTIQNFGSSPLTNFYLDYSVNGSPVKTMYWTGSIASLDNEAITLNSINYFPSATNTLTVNVSQPNGATDPRTSDDEVVLEFGTASDVSNTVTMTLKLDNYGAEVSWELLNASDAQLYSGGPYSNNNAATITETFNLASGDCYRFITHDSYGDGLLGTGPGFTLKDDQNVTIVSNYAKYGAGGTIPFGVDAPQPDSSDVFTAIRNVAEEGRISIYPNPASGKVNVLLNLHGDMVSDLYLTNSVGQRVQTILQNANATGNAIQFETTGLQPGIYFLNAQTADRKYVEKTVVAF